MNINIVIYYYHKSNYYVSDSIIVWFYWVSNESTLKIDQKLFVMLFLFANSKIPK